MPDQKPTLEYGAERRYRKRWAIGIAITVMVLTVVLLTGFVVSLYLDTATTTVVTGPTTQDADGGVITVNYHISVSHGPYWVRLLILGVLAIGIGWVLLVRTKGDGQN